MEGYEDEGHILGAAQQTQASERLTKTLRWLLLLPIAVGCCFSVVMTGIALRESIPEEPSWVREAAYLGILVAASWVFVWVGARVAPAHNEKAAFVLAAVVTAAALKFCGFSGTGFLETGATAASAAGTGWRFLRRPKAGFGKRVSWFLVIAFSIPGLIFLPFVAGAGREETNLSSLATSARSRTYSANGVSLVYRDNWNLRPGLLSTDGATHVSFVTGHATLTIMQFRPPIEVSLDDYRQVVSHDFPLISERSHRSRIRAMQIAGESQTGRLEDLDVSVAGIEHPWRRLIFRIGRSDRTVFIFAEAPLTEWQRFEKDLNAVLASLQFS